MIGIRPASDADRLNISVLAVSAFGQPNEERLLERLRAEGCIAVELVAEDTDGLVGHLALARLVAPADWLTLLPVCVRTEQTHQGVGGDLILHGLDAARRARFKAVVVVGDPVFYHRFGFVFDGPAELLTSYPDRYVGLYPIDPATAVGRARLLYPEAFAAV